MYAQVQQRAGRFILAGFSDSVHSTVSCFTFVVDLANIVGFTDAGTHTHTHTQRHKVT